ncbi:MAG: hypothetical protein AB1410_08650 [Acidobacteriota bacterium]
MTLKRIKKIGYVSIGLFYGTCLGIIGTVVGFFVFLLSLISYPFLSQAAKFSISPIIGLLLMVFIPVGVFIIGFIEGLIGAFFCNIALSITKGLELEIE